MLPAAATSPKAPFSQKRSNLMAAVAAVAAATVAPDQSLQGHEKCIEY